jgi:group I intron endonuclease
MVNVNKPYIVYKHTSPSGKVYIGITCETTAQRWKRGKGYRSNQVFWKAIQKYGWDNIKHEILYSGLTSEEASQKEIELIAKYKSNVKGYGYNVASGGGVNCGFTINDSVRQKISEANKGKNNGMYGKRFKHTEEALKKIKAHSQSRDYTSGNNPKAKKVYQFSPDGQVVKVWDCIKHASEYLGISYSYLITIMNTHKFYRGFWWSYKGVMQIYGREQ